MIYEIIEVGTDARGVYIKVWDGGRDAKGRPEGQMSFYGVGEAKDFKVGRKLVLAIKLLPEEAK